MYMKAMRGTNASRPIRAGLGLIFSLPSSQRERSCRATKWQPHPQNHRPRIIVLRIASAKKIRPALMMPCLENSIASDGSSGESVLPPQKYH